MTRHFMIIDTDPNPPLTGLTRDGKTREIYSESCLAIPCSQGIETQRCSTKLARTTQCGQGQPGQFNKTLPVRADSKKEVTESRR